MLETILEIPIKSPPPHLAKTTSATPIVIPVKYWNPPKPQGPPPPPPVPPQPSPVLPPL